MAKGNVVRMNIGGLQATIIALRKAQTAANGRRVLGRAFERAGALLLEQIRKNISLTDHTLEDLAKMDHPYAKRHGSIQIHQGTTGYFITNPTSLVHSHAGKLVNALSGKFVRSRKAYKVRLNRSKAKYAKWIVEGSKVMLPRDPLWDTATHPEMQRIMMREIVIVLGKELRTQTAIRFSGAK